MKRKVSKSELDYRERQLTIFFKEHMEITRHDRKDWIYAASKLTRVAPENFNTNNVEVGKVIRERQKTKFESHYKSLTA